MDSKPTYEELEQRIKVLEENCNKFRKSESEYKEAKAQLTATINALPDLLFEVDRSGRIYRYLAPQADRLYASPEHFLGKPVTEILPQPASTTIMTAIEEAFKTGHHYGATYQLELPSGLAWFELSIARKETKSSQDAIMIVLARDITERKQMEAKILSEKEFTDIALDAQVDTFFLFEPATGKALRWNRSFKDISGYTNDEITRMPAPSSYYGPDDLKRAGALIQVVLEEGIGTIELDLICKDGKKIPTEYRVSVINNKQGEPKYLISIGRDITERKKIEKEFRVQKNKLESIVNVMDSGLTIRDLDYNVTFQNNYVSKYFNGLGKKCYQAYEGRDKICDGCPVEMAYKDGKSHTVIREVVMPSGKIGVWQNTANPIRDADGNIVSCLEIATNITEKKILEEQLRQSQKVEAIGTFAGGIAHDFNNMLGIITGNVSFVLSKLKNEGDLTEALNDVQETARRATALTKQLITFAKGGAPIKKVIDLNQLLKETTKLVLRGASSTCNFNMPEDLWTVEADEGQLNQAISNLIINAMQAMPEGGMIHLISENIIIDENSSVPLPVGSYVSIKIIDQGTGISEKHLAKIFDPFFTTKHKGSGLGLATTFSIIKRHEGHIWAESQLGEGTTFAIYLPATEKATDQPNNNDEVAHKGRGKILVMDDEEAMLKMARRMIGEMGYETIFAKDGTQAIELYREAFQSSEPFDLVILDLTIPGGMGGAKAIPELLKINPDAKVVVSSGYFNDPVMSNYKDYGFVGVVPKPYSTDQMAELLNEILGKKE